MNSISIEELRILGGMNFVMFGDTRQFPPIPESSSLFIPPGGKTTKTAREVLDIFWSDKADSLNFFMELTIQNRITDGWYNHFLHECRQGRLTDEQYNFIMGLPTQHTGCWLPESVSDGLGDDPFCSVVTVMIVPNCLENGLSIWSRIFPGIVYLMGIQSALLVMMNASGVAG